MRTISFNNVKGFKRTLIIAAVSLTMLVACKQEAQSQGSTETRKKFHWEEERCTGDILVHLGDHLLAVPRTDTTLTITLEDGTPVRQLHRTQPGYECNVTEIKEKAVEVRWSDYGVSVIKEKYADKQYKGLYGNFEKQITQARAEGKVEFWDNGIEVVRTGVFYLILPKDKANTLNGYPVTFMCTNLEDHDGPPILGHCSTNYADPRRLVINYKFHLSRDVPKNAIEYDQQQRDRLSDMIEKANNKGRVQ